jgi:hypothetical protein
MRRANPGVPATCRAVASIVWGFSDSHTAAPASYDTGQLGGMQDILRCSRGPRYLRCSRYLRFKRLKIFKMLKRLKI